MIHAYAYGHHELPGDLQDSGGGIIKIIVCVQNARERSTKIKFKERRCCIYMHTMINNTWYHCASASIMSIIMII